MTGVDAEMLAILQKAFSDLLDGDDVLPVEIPAGLGDTVQQLAVTINRFLQHFADARRFAAALAAGDLEETPPARNQVAASFKQLHAGLQHLTWQTGQIARGDYSQRVHFMGEFSDAFNHMVEALAEKERVEAALREARNQVRSLEGIIPICMYCKKIRDDGDSWLQLERYISEHSEAQFSHGICPACFEQRYEKKT